MLDDDIAKSYKIKINESWNKELTLYFCAPPRLSLAPHVAHAFIRCRMSTGAPTGTEEDVPNWLGVARRRINLQLEIDATMAAVDRLMPMRRLSAGRLRVRRL